MSVRAFDAADDALKSSNCPLKVIHTHNIVVFLHLF